MQNWWQTAIQDGFLGRPRANRLLPLDALRGTLIVLMALDHANGLIGGGKLDPELWANLFPNYRGDTLAFLTRFVTHLAAPGFFFLLGAGMALFAKTRRRQGWSSLQIGRFFAVRGLVLITLQFLAENPAWNLGAPPSRTTYFGVLYALGGVMVLGLPLLVIPRRWLVALSLALVVSIELLLPGARTGFIEYPPVQVLLLLPGYTAVGAGGFWVLYPIIPWLGVLGLGISYGRWLVADQEKALRGALWIGLGALLIFLPVRLMDGFGNIRPISPAGPRWMAILNLVKYPPGIAFLLFTLGADLVVLGIFARVKSSLPRAVLQGLAVYGQAPLFFYLAHLYLYATLGLWLAPTGIPRMLPYWLLGLEILFPFCWLYGRFKHTRSPESIWRLF